ncbi:MAG: exonuclease domain-containing protein [Mangrovibacterium sp.]
MKLNLKNPIIFFDLETTGIDVSKDRIVEIALIKVLVNGEEEVKELRINPGVPIPAESSAVHGIYDADVADCPTFKEVAKSLARFMEGCDLGGFNSNRFDIPLLAEEFLRAEVDIDLMKRKFVDVQTIFHKMEKRTLVAAYRFYCNEELEGAHGAMADTRATYEVLKSQLDRYQGVDFKDQNDKITQPIVNDIQALSEFSSFNENVDFAGRIIRNEQGVEVFNFGKNKGVPVEKVLREQPGYYAWMMDSDFPLYTKRVLTEIKLKMALGPKQ